MAKSKELKSTLARSLMFQTCCMGDQTQILPWKCQGNRAYHWERRGPSKDIFFTKPYGLMITTGGKENEERIYYSHGWWITLLDIWNMVRKPCDRVYKVPLNIIAVLGILPATLTVLDHMRTERERAKDRDQCCPIKGESLYNCRYKSNSTSLFDTQMNLLLIFRHSLQGRCSHCNLTIKEDMFRSIAIIPWQRI